MARPHHSTICAAALFYRSSPGAQARSANTGCSWSVLSLLSQWPRARRPMQKFVALGHLCKSFPGLITRALASCADIVHFEGNGSNRDNRRRALKLRYLHITDTSCGFCIVSLLLSGCQDPPFTRTECGPRDPLYISGSISRQCGIRQASMEAVCGLGSSFTID